MSDPRIAEAVDVLRRGGLVAVPTETVYGLAADPRNPRAVARIFEAKGRPPGRPLPILLPGASHLGRWAGALPHGARALAERYWPGPLTLVVPAADDVPRDVTGGLATIGLRVPDHPLTLELLAAFGGGLATPSANRHGSVSPTSAEAVRADLGDRVDLVLDGGPTAVGVESTVLELASNPPRILRPGAVGADAIAALLGTALATGDGAGTTRFRLATPVELVDAEAADARVAELRAAGADVRVVGVGDRLYERLAAADAAGADRLLVVRPSDPALATAVAARLGLD